MIKKVIAVDIDDVLCRSAEGFAAFSNKRWNSGIAAHDYDEAWARVWGVTNDEAARRADELHASGAIGTYMHFDTAAPVLAELGKNFDLVVVTSRRVSVKKETHEWLKSYFYNVFASVHYLGVWESDMLIGDKLQATKTDICRSIGASYLIDDQLKHCLGAAEAGLQAVLFGDYSWNKAPHLPSGVTRASDWQGVRRYFNGQ